MQVRGITLDEWVALVTDVSRKQYGGNIEVHRDAHQTGVKKFTVHGRLIAKNSTGPGTRRSASGRRMPVCCWHVYRDVLIAFFELRPNSVVTTKLARYEGRDGFEATYPLTGLVNVGSLARQACLPDLCECPGSAKVFEKKTKEPEYTPGRAPDQSVFGPPLGTNYDYGDAHIMVYSKGGTR